MAGIGTPAIPSTGGGGISTVNQGTSPWIISGAVTQSGAPWTIDLIRIGGTSFSLGQQLATASLPIVLTAAQISTLTPLSTVAATQSGTWNIGTITTLTTPVSTKTTLTASSPATTSVGTSSAQAVASNVNRKGLILTNTSGNIIYFGIGATAVVGSGIVLTPYGVFVMDEYSFTTGAFNAIASGASSNLAIQEYVT